MPIIPDWNVMLHTAEDTVSNCMGILGPRVFGIKTTKVLPNVGDDENIQKKARYVQFCGIYEQSSGFEFYHFFNC